MQQVDRRWLFLCHTLAGQQERRHHRLGMICAQGTTPPQELRALLLIALYIVCETASGLFDICSCLVERERESLHDRDQFSRGGVLGGYRERKLLQVGYRR